MRRKPALCAFGVVIAWSGALASPATTQAAGHTNMVVTWNEIALSTFATANVPPPAANRLGAIVQAAVFDAVNGIDQRYTAIHVQSSGPADASAPAAAAGAAHEALATLFPGQKPSLDAALATSIAALADEEDAQSVAADGDVGPRGRLPRVRAPHQPAADRTPSGIDEHLDRRRDDRGVRREERVQLMAPGDRDRSGRYGRQPRHESRSDMAATSDDALLPGISLCALRRKQRCSGRAGVVLR